MFRVFFVFVCLGLCLPSAIARPKIGLALSGGGAKGAAHIGVLKLLEENNIPVDYIAGTSMGSLFAGMYAMGYSAEEIEREILALNWTAGYEDAVARKQLTIRQKQQLAKFQFNDVIGLSLEGVQVRAGMVQGQTMGRLLRISTENLEPLKSFDDLPIPFRSVATDIETVSSLVQGLNCKCNG